MRVHRIAVSGANGSSRSHLETLETWDTPSSFSLAPIASMSATLTGPWEVRGFIPQPDPSGVGTSGAERSIVVNW
jgi:hypothetical protein